MKVTIIGASGLVGRHLTAALLARGDSVSGVSFRDMATARRECDGAGAVVNLAGESVATRWTPEVKDRIRSSRVDLPRQLIEHFDTLAEPPKAYVSASAVGYYGSSETQTFTEASGPGSDFLASVCVEWETQAKAAAKYGCRVAVVRTGLALATDGGVLARILPVFKMGGGGVLGSGNQWCSWIHIDDLVNIYLMAIDRADGILNATAPNPVRNRDFTKALAAALHRPAFIGVPESVLSAMLGEGASIAVKGQCVVPERTTALGFRFAYTLVERAFVGLVGKRANR